MGVDTGCGQSAFPAGGGGGTVPPLIPTAMPRSAVPPERRLHQQPLQRGLELRHQPRQRQGHLHLPLGLHGAGLQPGCGRVLAGYGQPGAGEPVGNSPMGVGGSDGGGRHTPNCSRGQGSQSSPSPVLHPPPPRPHQAPTPVSTRASASTRWARSSASVCRATPARAARSTSTSVCRTRVRTTPPVWIRSGSSSVSACPVRGRLPA